MTFGEAFAALKDSERVSRRGWSGGMWLTLVTSWNGNFGGDLPPTWSVSPFIAIKATNDTMVPWLATQTDMMAEDWGIVATD